MRVYCRWLIRLLDDWNREEMPMKKDAYGVWEITVPAKDGQPAIPHNSKVKVRLRCSIINNIC